MSTTATSLSTLPMPTLADLAPPVVLVADHAQEPWMGCESVHPMTWVPGFEAAVQGDRSGSRFARGAYARG